MNFHVLTLFPDMIRNGVESSILGRALSQKLIQVNPVNIRDFSTNKHHKVDDYPYGGGAGMLMQAQPVFDACSFVMEEIQNEGRAKPRVLYLTPQGEQLDQPMAKQLSGEEDLILLCGHYEGIDERVLEEVVTDYVSIGDFVLTGGELPALILIDAVSRLVPGVLHNQTSAETESFDNDLLEYPHYSRPEEWHGMKVPAVLLSGDHKKIMKWRLEQSIKKTSIRRPDLYKRYEERQKLADELRKNNKVLYMDIIETLRRGSCTILNRSDEGCMIWDEAGKLFLLALFDETKADSFLDAVGPLQENKKYVLHHKKLCEAVERREAVDWVVPCRQAVYTKREQRSLPKDVEFRVLTIDLIETVLEHYHMVPDRDYIENRILAGKLIGIFSEGKMAGFAGVHQEGSMGMLEIFPDYRRHGFGEALESFLINQQLIAGQVPYCHIVSGNDASLALQTKLEFRISEEAIFWLSVREKAEK